MTPKQAKSLKENDTVFAFIDNAVKELRVSRVHLHYGGMVDVHVQEIDDFPVFHQSSNFFFFCEKDCIKNKLREFKDKKHELERTMGIHFLLSETLTAAIAVLEQLRARE